MDCPACGFDRHKVVKCLRYSDMDERHVLCTECGSEWWTATRVTDLIVRNPNNLKPNRVAVDKVDQYRDYLLRRGPHPTDPYTP